MLLISSFQERALAWTVGVMKSRMWMVIQNFNPNLCTSSKSLQFNPFMILRDIYGRCISKYHQIITKHSIPCLTIIELKIVESKCLQTPPVTC